MDFMQILQQNDAKVVISPVKPA